jgi:hypothetical protein
MVVNQKFTDDMVIRMEDIVVNGRVDRAKLQMLVRRNEIALGLNPRPAKQLKINKKISKHVINTRHKLWVVEVLDTGKSIWTPIQGEVKL